MSVDCDVVGMTDALGIRDAAERSEAVLDRIGSAAVVDREVLETILTAVLARGHVLLEDVPGTGKTVTARVLAEALGLEFARIQFTPDLLPSDITGSNVYNEHEGRFEFAAGPVFTNVVLADEINRAPPKTQAALLETMEERQVSVDGETHQLPDPFVVVATQNPIEQEGTFRLPEAQRDRFSVKTSIGYNDIEGEMELLARRADRRTLAPSVDPAADAATVRAMREAAEDVRVDEDVRRYIVHLARATRDDDRAAVGVSPRGIQRTFEAARARAVLSGREYVTPDDVKRIAEPAMAHRIVLTTDAGVEGVDARQIVRDAMDAVDVPGVAPGTDESPSADDPTGGGQAQDRPTDGSGDIDSVAGSDGTDTGDPL
jgi:MoxR-like ATPase